MGENAEWVIMLDRDDYNVDLQYRYQEENTDPQVEKLLKLMTQLTESQINLIYDHFGAGKQLEEICDEENAANGTTKKPQSVAKRKKRIIERLRKLFEASEE